MIVELLRAPGAGRPGRADDAQLAAALEVVVDPCSLAQGTPLALDGMGLLRGRTLDDDGTLTVDLCVTAPGCTFVGVMAAAVVDAVRELPGVGRVVVRLDADVLWSEELLRPDAAATLAAARRAGRPAPPAGLVPAARRGP